MKKIPNEYFINNYDKKNYYNLREQRSRSIRWKQIWNFFHRYKATKLPERHELLNDDLQWKLIRPFPQSKKKKKEKEEKSNCGSALNQSRFDRSNSDSDRDAPGSGRRGISG